MPLYRDKVTGKVANFDHDPTEQELESHFQGTSPQHNEVGDSMKGDPGPSFGESLATNVAAPGIGAIIGGKTPLGPVGSAIGAATGSAYGDLYNMFKHGQAYEGMKDVISHPIDTLSHITDPAAVDAMKGEAAKLGAVGLGTLGTELAVPPILRGIGNILPKHGLGTLGGTGLGYLFGHPGYGAAAGVASELAPKVANAVEWAGTPAEYGILQAAKQAKADFLAGAPSAVRGTPTVMANAKKAGDAALAEGWQKMNPVSKALSDTSGLNDRIAQLKQAPGYIADKASQAFNGLKSVGKRAFDAADEWMTKEPPPTPAPTPEASTVRSTVDYAAKRASEINAQGTPWKEAMGKASKEAGWPLGKSSATDMGAAPPPSGGYGPNTVGAAQAKGSSLPTGTSTYLPQSVNEAKGLSLPEQNAWEAYKSSNPGTTDAHLDDWYRSNRLGGNPNEGLPVPSLIDNLMNLIGKGR